MACPRLLHFFLFTLIFFSLNVNCKCELVISSESKIIKILSEGMCLCTSARFEMLWGVLKF